MAKGTAAPPPPAFAPTFVNSTRRSAGLTPAWFALPRFLMSRFMVSRFGRAGRRRIICRLFAFIGLGLGRVRTLAFDLARWRLTMHRFNALVAPDRLNPVQADVWRNQGGVAEHQDFEAVAAFDAGEGDPLIVEQIQSDVGMNRHRHFAGALAAAFFLQHPQ